MKNINKIALYFMAIVLLLVTISQSVILIFEFELNTGEKHGLFGALEVLSKYKAFDNIWFAMSSQILTIVLFAIIFVFVIKELINKNKL